MLCPMEMIIVNGLQDVERALAADANGDVTKILDRAREYIDEALRSGVLFDITPHQQRFAALQTATLFHEADAESALVRQFLAGAFPGMDATGTWVAAWNAVRVLEARGIDVADRLQQLLAARAPLGLEGSRFDPESAQFVGR